MVRNKPGWQFPSGMGPTAFEIQKIAPKKKQELSSWMYISITILLLLWTLLLILFGIEIYGITHANKANAQEPYVLVEGNPSLSSFCKQAVKDHDSYGRDLSESLKDYCNLTN